MPQKLLVVLATLAVVAAVSYGVATAADAKKNNATPAAAEAAKDAAALSPDAIIAKVNGVAIKGADVLEVKNSMRPPANQMPLDVIYGQLQERLIDAQLVLEAAQKSKLENDAEVQKQLAKAKDRILQDVYLTREVGQKITNDVVSAKYEELGKQFKPQTELQASHILVATEDEAKAIATELKKGADFAKIAKEKSTDKGSAEKGGDLGFFTQDQVVEPFAKAAFALKDGEISAPVKSEFGWHIIKATARRDTKMPSLEQSKAEIQRIIADEKVAALFQSLRQNAKIEKFGLDGKPIAAAPIGDTAPAAADGEKKTQ